MNEIINRYKDCLDKGKTERECIRLAISMAEKSGYRSLHELISSNTQLKAGDKVYATYNEKTMVMFNIGKDDLENGMNILGAHVDSPRIDVKQNPLYEEEGMAFLDTHYYGGIKKYQWVTIPLALHGVIVKKDGTRVNVVIGEKEDDPVFAISDLLIHLSGEQLEKKQELLLKEKSWIY